MTAFAILLSSIPRRELRKLTLACARDLSMCAVSLNGTRRYVQNRCCPKILLFLPLSRDRRGRAASGSTEVQRKCNFERFQPYETLYLRRERLRYRWHHVKVKPDVKVSSGHVKDNAASFRRAQRGCTCASWEDTYNSEKRRGPRRDSKRNLPRKGATRHVVSSLGSAVISAHTCSTIDNIAQVEMIRT